MRLSHISAVTSSPGTRRREIRESNCIFWIEMIKSHHDGHHYTGTSEASSISESQDTDDEEAEQELNPSHWKLVFVLADILTIVLLGFISNLTRNISLLLNGEI